jgi:hypothetical protein
MNELEDRLVTYVHKNEELENEVQNLLVNITQN